MAVGFAFLAIWLGVVMGGLGLLVAGVVSEMTNDRDGNQGASILTPGPVRAAQAILEENGP
jgi:hypothetical protein